MYLPIRNISYILNYLKDQGQDISPLLEIAKLQTEQLNRLEDCISIEQFELLITQILKSVNSPASFAINLGRSIPLTAHGKMSLGLITAKNFGCALDFAKKFYPLATPFASYSFEKINDTVGVTININTIQEETTQLLNFMAVTILDRLTSLYSGSEDNLSQIAFVRIDEDSKKAFEKAFPSAKLIIGSTYNTVQFKKSVLGLASPFSDSQVFKNVETACAESLKELIETSTTTALLSQMISSKISDPPSLEESARFLNTTPRKLRYKLKQEGSNFQNLIKDVKINFAKELLSKGDRQIAEIGYLLGYSEPSNFSISFKRWTGISPKDFRASSGSHN